ncbi:MAG: hypothetical protein HKN46_07750 [Acidimicrobiia bacterium]|nr:hypothetical protein [Acidimicrobiia bacterium]
MADPVGRFAVSRLGCRLVNGRLPDRILGSAAADSLFELHLETCLVCQAEAAQQGSLVRAVADLPDPSVPTAPRGLVDEVMDGIARREHAARVRGRALTAGGLGVVSAGLTVLIWLLGRRKSLEARTGG